MEILMILTVSTFSPNIKGLQENISAGIGKLCAK